MTQHESNQYWKLGLASSLVISGMLACFSDCTLAQLLPDGTLGAESSRVTSTSPGVFQIDGGATRGKNLFHSFSQFSVPTNGIAYFNNLNIQNIISRVTGGSVSRIDGLLQANGIANLFLINPNGIIFGPNATLRIGGSFLATTASSLNFADGTQFSATVPQNKPLLTISVPIGLQFGENPGNIINQSQASLDGATNSLMSPTPTPAGLEVQTGRTLALIGGDVALEGGNLTATGGRIELGSVAGNSLVRLKSTEKVWALSYEGVNNFQNIQLTSRNQVDGSKIQSFVDVSGDSGGSTPSGNVQAQGRRITLTGGSQILATNSAAQLGGNLKVTASESVELIGASLKGESSELSTTAFGTGKAGDITFNTRYLSVRGGAQALSATRGQGKGGQLTVTAPASVELDGAAIVSTSDGVFVIDGGLYSTTFGTGDAGDITLNTGRLIVKNGAQVSTSSTGQNISGQFILATGRAGALTVNASKSVELIGTDANASPSSLSASTLGSGVAGNLNIATGQLIIRDEAVVSVSSEGTGDTGNLQVQARSIRLDNQGQLTATSAFGEGGNVTLQAQELLLMRHNSQISSTTAGLAGAGGNGGNITIKVPFIVAAPSENSDIKANAFLGQGGKITINSQRIFGLVVLNLKDLQTLLGTNDPTKLDPINLPSSDITAISQTNPSLSGQVTINTLDINPIFGLVNLPVQPVNVTGLIAQGCPTGVGPRGSKFVITGHGGLPPTPREALSSEQPLADLGTPLQGQENRASAVILTGHGGLPPTPREALSSEQALADLGTPLQGQENRASAVIPRNTTNSEPEQIVEATGWVINAKGKVVLVANPPTFTPNIPWMAPTTCHT